MREEWASCSSLRGRQALDVVTTAGGRDRRRGRERPIRCRRSPSVWVSGAEDVLGRIMRGVRWRAVFVRGNLKRRERRRGRSPAPRSLPVCPSSMTEPMSSTASPGSIVVRLTPDRIIGKQFSAGSAVRSITGFQTVGHLLDRASSDGFSHGCRRRRNFRQRRSRQRLRIAQATPCRSSCHCRTMPM